MAGWDLMLDQRLLLSLRMLLLRVPRLSSTVRMTNRVKIHYHGLLILLSIILTLSFAYDASLYTHTGPMGVFEIAPFDQATKGLVDVLEDLTNKGTITVVGGGDSVAAMEQFGKTKAVSYISTGGGATLELLAGDELPGVTAITDVTVTE